MSWIEKDRLLGIKTPLGADKLLLRAFTGQEGISRLFHFHLRLLSEDASVNFDDIVGRNVTFSVKLYEMGEERYFNGYVSRFVQCPSEERLAQYEADVVPWLWFLTRTADCHIFQNMTVPDIITKVFGEAGFTDFEKHLQETYEPWEYCVQYRETAFDFVSRLMEEEGIFYFFRHEDGGHVMVIADAPSAFKPCPGQSRIMYERHTGAGVKRHEDTISLWRTRQELRTGKYALTDYNFETPSTSLLATTTSAVDQGGNQRFEVFDYPGEYEKRDQGDSLAKVRIEEQEAAHTLATGESNCRAFAVGHKFDLKGFERKDQNATYALTGLVHSAEEGGFYSGQGSGEARYVNTFEAIPFAVKFRPPRVTRKPLVHGAQTAVVVGPGGEEIFTDKYGRVKVQFHWDRRGQKNENSSCWIRVAQIWAGKNWGAIAIPRIGQEVVVDFLEGDPDRPLITGSVYNAQQMPPYELPANQTQTGIKSRSSKSGAASNFNEIRFEDKKGQEDLTIHAERVMNESVEANQYITVGGDRHITTGAEKNGSRTGDTKEKVFRDRNLHVLGAARVAIDGKSDENYKGKSVELHGDDHCLGVSGKLLVTGLEITLQADVKITLVAGGSHIVLDGAGVTIVGPLVNLNPMGAMPVIPQQKPSATAPDEP
jgi:type VI secretion system secreted protein VgrG